MQSCTFKLLLHQIYMCSRNVGSRTSNIRIQADPGMRRVLYQGLGGAKQVYLQYYYVPGPAFWLEYKKLSVGEKHKLIQIPYH